MLTIRSCTFSEIENAPNFPALVEEYANEVKVEGVPPVNIKKEIYRELEAKGVFQIFVAYLDDVLIGFITVLTTVLPHFGVVMAVSESYFVAKEYRFTGAGNKLRSVAEEFSARMGAPILLISAPIGSILCDILENSSEYTPTNKVFLKRLKNVNN